MAIGVVEVKPTTLDGFRVPGKVAREPDVTFQPAARRGMLLVVCLEGWSTMNIWKYHDITSDYLTFLNPLSTAKLDEIIGYLDLPQGARVLDIACGKAEPLIRIAERYQIHGVGIDISEFFIAAAAREAAKRVALPSQVELLVMDGKDYHAELASFDLSICLGATWVYGGLAGTLEYLSSITRSQGLIMVGEPYWRSQPTTEYLEAAKMPAEAFGTHAGNIEAALAAGLIPLHSTVSDQDDWDRYEWSRIRAGERYALQRPEDPDVAELTQRVAGIRDSFIRFGGRDLLGWAVYLSMKP